MSAGRVPDVETIAATLALAYGSHVSPPRGGRDWKAAEAVHSLLIQELLAVLRDDHDALLLHASAAAGVSPVRAQVLRDRAMGVRMAMERIAAL